MQIKRIVNKSDSDLEILSAFMMNWWGKDEGFCEEKMRAYMQNLVNADMIIPQCFSLTENRRVIGCFQISMSDADVRPDLYPWLINVFIEPESRGKGYFHDIMKQVTLSMRDLKLKNLYLYTKHVGLYERFGWKFISEFKTYITPSDVQRLYVLNP